MPSISSKSNRRTPSIGSIGHNLPTHTAALRTIKEAIEVHERRTGNVRDSFVRVGELIDLGILREVDDQFVTPIQNQKFDARWVDDNKSPLNASNLEPRFIVAPFRGIIRGVYVLTTGGTGSCSVDIRKSTFADFPPVAADTIVDYAPPSISSGVAYYDTGLDGWDVGFEANDIFSFVVESTSTFDQIEVALIVEPVP